MLGRTLTAATLLALALPGCGGGVDFVARETRLTFEPAAGRFWSLPFPSDAREQSDGSYDFERFPAFGAETPVARSNPLVGMWLDVAKARVRGGFGPSGGVFFTTSGPLDPSSLPASPAASLGLESSVFLVDIDDDSPERGRFLPLDVAFLTEGDRFAPPNLLAARLVFGYTRRPSTRYAAVVTDAVRDAAGAPLGRSEAFHAAFEGEDGADAALVSGFQRLRALLEEAGLDPARVVGATVFGTLDHNALLLRLADWAESLPLPAMGDWVHAESHESFELLTSSFTVPVFQTGRRPYADIGEGRIEFEANGDPKVVGAQDVRLALTVPKRRQPAAGFPLTLYLHGSGSNWRESADRAPKPEDGSSPTLPPEGRGPAEWLARRGVATLGFDFPLHGNRHSPPDTSGLVFYNLFGNIDATIDNYHTTAVELILLSRLILEARLDPNLAPNLDAGDAPDGRLRFDPERLTAMGQSMGTTLAVPWATVDRRVKGLVLSGAGGVLVEIGVTAIEPVPLKGFVERLLELPEGESLHIHHPLLHAFQHVWDLVDPIAKARYVSQEPHPGVPPKHIFMSAGVRDGYFHPRSQAAMAAGLGIPLVGEEVEPILPETLALDGRQTRAYPLGKTLGDRVAGVVQFAAPNALGHYVLFNQEGARHQYTCFVASVGTGREAIHAARGLEDPCP